MRRLKPFKKDNQRGAAGVIVAVLVLVLIGAGALAVDLGQIYGERAQLQNGADAAALAVARSCYEDSCTQASADLIASELANKNALDGGSALSAPVDLSTDKEVTVRTSTRQGEAGPGFLNKLFASALNAPPVTVGAKATARIFFPSSSSGFPLAISDDCFNLSSASDMAPVQRISYKPGGTCTGPSGTQIPGGWGWLDQIAPCEAATEVGTNQVGSDPGNPPPTQCQGVLQGWKDTIVANEEVLAVFPVFDDATNQGQNGLFNVIGYATFKIWGWKFGNNGTYEFRNLSTDPNMTAALACSGGNDRCIIGQFVKYVSNGSGGGGTGGIDLGTVEIRLTD
ncbi:pilus assembly protein TadG-related protein [Arthrobacter sp. P2b]|uniref:pilus assembly protein TadG-related protein n=1 Tax=Arthrobacter sp. P2b TaxID=1938741 RepID=UPI0009A6A800|nr:pilus assembly protein TadG-related protein [Arthrobacter sp. P2b]SLK01470.1 Flp pilus assembly protein TadG [Arthrobacter sp. P2b]